MSYVMTQAGSIDHLSTSVITGGAFLISSTVSAFSKADGIPIFEGPITYTFLGGSAPGFVDGTVVSIGPQVLSPTSIGYDPPVVREGDVGVMLATGSLIGGGTSPVSGEVEVVDAGQEEARAV